MRAAGRLLLLLFLALAGPAVAQAPSAAAPDRADQGRPVSAEPRSAEPPPALAHVGPAQSVAPFTVTEVVVVGSTLPAEELAAAWRPFVGREVGGADLVQITDALAAVYARRRIAIYTMVIPGQSFAGGVV